MFINGITATDNESVTVTRNGKRRAGILAGSAIGVVLAVSALLGLAPNAHAGQGCLDPNTLSIVPEGRTVNFGKEGGNQVCVDGQWFTVLNPSSSGGDPATRGAGADTGGGTQRGGSTTDSSPPATTHSAPPAAPPAHKGGPKSGGPRVLQA